MPTAQDLLTVAYNELGYKNKASRYNLYDKNANVYNGTNGGRKYTKYGLETFGNPVGDWCAYFVTWCFQQIGARNLIFGGSSVVSAFRRNFTNNHQTVSPSQARPGDLFLTSGHIGIIWQVINSNSFRSLEGNASGPPRQVATIVRTYRNVTTICRPAYDSNSVYIPPDKPILDSSATFKLANVLMKNDRGELIGQLATGIDNSKCIRIRVWDEESKKVQQIKNVVKTDTLGNAQWVSRHLIEMIPNAGYVRKVLAGQYRLDSPFDFNFGTVYPFKIDFYVNLYRPSGYTDIINLLSNYSAVTNIGWQLFVTEDNHLSLLRRGTATSIQQVIFEDFVFDTTMVACQESGEYYNKETKTLEWKNADGTAKSGTPKTYWVGKNTYHIVLEKPVNSNNITLTVNNRQYTMQRFYTHNFYGKWLTTGTRSMLLGDYAQDPDQPNNKTKVIPITFISGVIDISAVKNISLANSRFYAITNGVTKKGDSWLLKSSTT